MKNPLPFLHKFFSRLINLSLLVFGFVVFGVVGLMLFEGLTFLEAFWTVTNVITTVGASIRNYNELSESGRIFIIFLMWIGIFLFLTAISIIAFDLLEGKYQKAYKLYKMENKLNSLQQHVIICGFGRNGRQAVRKLQKYQKKILVIDQKKIEIYEGGEFENILFYEGNATLDEVLLNCGIQRAEAIISAMPNDADNLYTVMTARQLNPNLKIISRASDSNSINKLKRVGADNVIMPDKIGGEHMASMVVTPDLVEFIDQINFEGIHNRNLLEISTEQIPSEFLHQPLQRYVSQLETTCLVIGYKDSHKNYVMNPDSELPIQPNEYIIFFGRNEQILELKKKLNLN